MTYRRYPARCEFDSEQEYLRACERVDLESLDHLIVVVMPIQPERQPSRRAMFLAGVVFPLIVIGLIGLIIYENYS